MGDVLVWSRPAGFGSITDLVDLVTVRRRGEYGSIIVVGHGGGSGILCRLGMYDVGQKGLLSMLAKRNGADYG
jgi:hypothetical protein